MLGFGHGIWKRTVVLRGSGSGVEPLAPGPGISIVSWVTTPTTDPTPNLQVNLPSGNAGDDAHLNAAAGDVLQVRADGSLWFQHTLTSDDISNDTITVTGVDPLADGSWDIDVRLTRTGAEPADWSEIATGVIDATAPTIQTLSPADNAVDVAIGTNLVVTFDENVAFGASVDIALFLTDDTPVDAWDETDIDGAISISGAVLTINPGSDLTNEAGYYVQITSGSIEDTTGNVFAGITDETTWSFTTVSGDLVAPTLTVDTASSDNTPGFTVSFTGGEVDDVITLEIDRDGASFANPDILTDTLDAGEISAGEVTFTSRALLADDYQARAKHTRGAEDSAYSTTEDFTVDLTDFTGPGIVFPSWFNSLNAGAPGGVINNSALEANATNEYIGVIGRVVWEGRAATKTIDTSGSSEIGFHTSSGVLWATSGSTVRFGISDVDTSSGPSARSDGTFDVYKDFVQGTDTINASAWNTFTPTGGAGKALAHGQLVFVGAFFSTRNGADVFRLGGVAGFSSGGIPGVHGFDGSSWAAKAFLSPIRLVASDGTNGWIEFNPNYSATTESFNSSGTNERGLIFEVEHRTKIETIFFNLLPAGSTSDIELQIYSDPLGTPTSILSGGTAISIPAETLANAQAYQSYTFAPSDRPTIEADTPYIIAIKGAGAGNVTLGYWQFAAAGQRVSMANGANLRKGARASGAFTETTTLVPYIAFTKSAY